MDHCMDIRARLAALADPGYKAFHAGLMPTVDPALILGVRVPDLRKLARDLAGTEAEGDFLAALPHRYYEENNLHGLLVCRWKGYEETVAALDRFLPHVDNWATCDLLSPRAFEPRPPQLPGQITRWLADPQPYTARFGLGCLLRWYLDDGYFDPKYLDWAAGTHREDYYVRMMVAWYFATALAKQYDAALPYLEQGRLPLWTHNKAIQKGVESRRLSTEQKAYLRSLRRKG